MGKPYVRTVDANTAQNIGVPTLLVDNMEATLVKWLFQTNGLGVQTRDTALAFSGDASLKFTLPIEVGAPARFALTSRPFLPPRGSLFSLNFALRTDNMGNALKLGFQLILNRNGQRITYALAYVPATNKLQDGATFPTLANAATLTQLFPAAPNTWISYWASFDLSVPSMTQFNIFGVGNALVNRPMTATAATASEVATLGVRAEATTGQLTSLNLDDVVIVEG